MWYEQPNQHARAQYCLYLVLAGDVTDEVSLLRFAPVVEKLMHLG